MKTPHWITPSRPIASTTLTPADSAHTLLQTQAETHSQAGSLSLLTTPIHRHPGTCKRCIIGQSDLRLSVDQRDGNFDIVVSKHQRRTHNIVAQRLWLRTPLTFTTTASDWGFNDLDSNDAMTSVDITVAAGNWDAHVRPPPLSMPQMTSPSETLAD